MFKIIAPNRAYTGVIAGVAFLKGQAETGNARLIGWFKEKGYEIEAKEVIVKKAKGGK